MTVLSSSSTGGTVDFSVLNNEEAVGAVASLLDTSVSSLVAKVELASGVTDALSVSLVVTVSFVSGDSELGFSVLESDEAGVTAVPEVSLVSVSPDTATDGDSVLSIEETVVAVMSDSSVSTSVPSPEPSTPVVMRNDAVSGLNVAPLMEGMDSTIVDLLLVTSSSVSVTTDIMEAKLGDTVVELVSVSTEIGETDGSPVIDGSFVLSVSRLSVIPGDIAVGASVLKTEDVPVTEEVGVSGVWSPEEMSSPGVKMELCSVSSVMDDTEDLSV